MDKYIITYKLDGGSETVVDKSTWNDVASFIEGNKANFVEFAIKREGNPSKPTSLTSLFWSATKMTKCDMGNVDTSSVGLMNGMFGNCTSLVDLDIHGFDTSSLTNVTQMFLYCSSLEEIDLSHFNIGGVGHIAFMFYGCSSLTHVDFSGWDFSNMTSFNFAFEECSSLTELDLSLWDTSSLGSVQNMFKDCPNLKTIYVSDLWDNSSVTNSSLMFDGCTSLVGAVPYDPSKIDISMANYTTGYFTEKLIPPYRYWIGGSGGWDDTSHWSASSGGSGGASVPTSDDDVFIDNNSGFNSGGTITAPLGVCKGLVLSPGIAIDLKNSQIDIASLQAIGTSDNCISITGGTLSKPSGFVQCDYLVLEESTTTGGAKWYAGEHSIDNGGNIGWRFGKKRKYPLPARPWKA